MYKYGFRWLFVCVLIFNNVFLNDQILTVIQSTLMGMSKNALT